MAFTANELVVVDLFIAAYGRSPTQEGLDYWANELETGSKTSSEIAELMINNNEGHERFPEGLTTAEKVAQVFQNVLGRAPATQEGKDFWAAKFDDANYTMADLVDEVLKVAREGNPGDEETLENKRDVVEHFLDVIPKDQQAGFQVNTDPIVTDADVVVAKEGVDALLHAGVPLELTTKVDSISKDGHITDQGTDHQATVEATDKLNVKLSSSNDTIKADVGTLQTGDSIVDDSTDDHDTLDAQMESDLGTGPVTGTLNPVDGPTITNIEDITLHDQQTVDIYNLANVTGAKNVNIDSKQSDLFNSDNDAATLEIRNVDGKNIENLVAIDNTKGFVLTEVSNDANIILKDDFKNLRMDAKDGKDDETASVEMKGADFTLGLSDDNDDLSASVNDGGSFGELTLISADNASTITLAADTSLHNVSIDSNAGSAGLSTAEGTFQLAGTVPAAGTTTTDQGLTDKLLLDGDQDITIIGTSVQLDEAVIEEVTDDKLTSTLQLDTNVLNSVVDLTEAEVDFVEISQTANTTATALEGSEVDVDENTIAVIKAIADSSTLVVTGDSATDTLDIHIDTGNSASALGTLVLGGDAAASTTETTAGTAAGSGSEGSAAGTVAPDATIADADTAIITVDSNSNLNVLDVSQLTSNSFTIVGDKDLTIGELIMGGNGPGAANEPATTMDASAFTGDLTVNLTLAVSAGYEDGNDVNGDNGSGNTLLMGSGNDMITNVGVVATATDGYDHGDNLALGDGDDVVEIGSMVGNLHNDDAVSAEIFGQGGKDTYIFNSIKDTDEGNYVAGSLEDFSQGTAAPTAPTGANSTGVSLIQIEDFQAGSGGDQLDFNLFRDVDGQGSTKNDAEASPEIYDNGRIISASGSDNLALEDGNVVMISVDDINTFDASSAVALFGATAASVSSVFDDPEVGASGASDFVEFVFIVGETSGDDGVQLFYVREGGNADETASVIDHIGATLIGQLENINISELTDDNFDF